ncbi:hypothetical protein HBI56_205710 [Parastagonospora nodorum]|nr:hypothetical protein HBH56_115720 [Parastagonospora nodorum]KAH3928999.1 hypothetical protein HBH54_133430 [Parastagonospora nodorum]KAH3950839.1 hypothetical protein HBH53_073730 [Parastagonospora nodorum]KAH3965946.1 hypothetical protein HBH51_148030 [Parastagonospora nodorum]KAH3974015.1 hypothetical protein HBH52_138060 [Parastagonospora nodorum]
MLSSFPAALLAAAWYFFGIFEGLSCGPPNQTGNMVKQQPSPQAYGSLINSAARQDPGRVGLAA